MGYRNIVGEVEWVVTVYGGKHALVVLEKEQVSWIATRNDSTIYPLGS